MRNRYAYYIERLQEFGLWTISYNATTEKIWTQQQQQQQKQSLIPHLKCTLSSMWACNEMQTKEQHIKEKGKETSQMPFKAHHNIKLVARPKRGLPQIPPPLWGSNEKAWVANHWLWRLYW